MPRWLAALVFLVMAGAIIVYSYTNAPPHKFNFMKGECKRCHITYQYPFRFRDNITDLCNECHGSDNALSHVVGVTPSMYLSDEFPLDEHGEMTCNTCHNIHMERRDDITGRRTYLLRSNLRGKAFCDDCHSETLEILLPDATPSHAEFFSQAHFGYYSTETGTIDKVSLYCMMCHSGDIGSEAHVSLETGNPLYGSHPIGMKYDDAYLRSLSSRSDNMVPPEHLIPQIKFFEGRMGCPSCHDPFNLRGHKLVISNVGSRLCLACHMK